MTTSTEPSTGAESAEYNAAAAIRASLTAARPQCPTCRTRSTRLLHFYDAVSGCWRRLLDGKGAARDLGPPARPELTVRCTSQGRAHYDQWGTTFIPEALKPAYWEASKADQELDAVDEDVEAGPADDEDPPLWWAEPEFIADLAWLPLAS